MKTMTYVFAAVALALPLSVGCGGKQPAGPAGNAKTGDKHEEHAHPTEGPHKGQLIELGNEEYHLELIHDDAAHKITLYVLDSAGKQSVPTAAESATINLTVDGKPTQFTIPAARQATDPAGKSSCFALVDEKLGEAMDSPKAKGRVNIVIGGKPFAGTIGGHDHAGHKD